MRVFVSADMEGITGIATPEDCVRGEREYERGTDLMHRDVNAAVAGAAAAGADDIVVNDSHSSMRNLDRERLDDRAALVRGNTKPRSMMQGLTGETDAVLFVGYHAMAGTPTAVLNHTFLGHALVRLRVDGDEVGELGWNARLAGSLGVPVALVTGDDRTVAEAEAELGDPETVAVKTAVDRFSAELRPPSETAPEIEAAAARAIERARDGDAPVSVPERPVEISAAWSTTNAAARAAGTPGVERVGGRETAVTAERYPAAFEAAVAMLRTGNDGRNEFYG